MKQITVILFTILIVFWSCNKPNDKLIPKQTYKQILKEIILAGLIREKYPQKDSVSQNDILLLIYKKYQIDSLQLKKTTGYYSRHPEELAKIYAGIHAELKQISDSLDKLVPKKKKPVNDKITTKKNFLHFKKFIKSKQTQLSH